MGNPHKCKKCGRECHCQDSKDCIHCAFNRNDDPRMRALASGNQVESTRQYDNRLKTSWGREQLVRDIQALLKGN